MLFIHDLHAVIGEHEFDFEDTVRDIYAPGVARGRARLLWYLCATHGSGEAYKVVTITAVEDGAAWEWLVEEQRYGDLAPWRATADAMRYSCTSTLLVQLPWSPMGNVDLDTIPGTPGSERDPVVMREDVLEGPGIPAGITAVDERNDDVLACAAAFASVLSNDGPVHVLHRVAPRDRWTPTFGSDAGWADWSGSATADLPAGATRTSRMLRTTSWSPLH